MSISVRIKNTLIICMVVLLAVSVFFNIVMLSKNGIDNQPNPTADSNPNNAASQTTPTIDLRPNRVTYYSSNDSLVLENANSRETYFTIHNIKAAYEYGKGHGIKVGILDWGFAPDDHKDLYSGYENFNDSFNMHSEHGFWMAKTLREIAPDCEIYALDTYDYDSDTRWVDNLVNAIDWAIENELDVLTLSHKELSGENAQRFNEAIDKAVAHDIVTTFINNSNPNNILPGFLDNSRTAGKMCDVNIFPYDYNSIYYLPDAPNRKDIYLSYSSTSPVVGGFIAILKSINNTLSPAEYKDILVKTSSELKVNDTFLGKSKATHVVDIAKAAEYIKEKY